MKINKVFVFFCLVLFVAAFVIAGVFLGLSFSSDSDQIGKVSAASVSDTTSTSSSGYLSANPNNTTVSSGSYLYFDYSSSIDPSSYFYYGSTYYFKSSASSPQLDFGVGTKFDFVFLATGDVFFALRSYTGNYTVHFQNTSVTSYICDNSAGPISELHVRLPATGNGDPGFVYYFNIVVTTPEGDVYNFNLIDNMSGYYDYISSSNLSLSSGKNFYKGLGLSSSSFSSINVDYSGVGAFTFGLYNSTNELLKEFTVSNSEYNIFNSYTSSFSYSPSDDIEYLLIEPVDSNLLVYDLSFDFYGYATVDIVDNLSDWIYFYNSINSSYSTVSIYDLRDGFSFFVGTGSYNTSSDTLSMSPVSSSGAANSAIYSADDLNVSYDTEYILTFDVSSISGLSSSANLVASFGYYSTLTSSVSTIESATIESYSSYLTNGGSYKLTCSPKPSSAGIASEKLEGFYFGIECTTNDFDFVIDISDLEVSAVGGYSEGYEAGYNNGFNYGESLSYNKGYTAGYTAGSANALQDYSGISAISTIVNGVFDILGTNIFGLFSLMDILFVFITFSLFFLALHLIR